jgi:hypothetical protein
MHTQAVEFQGEFERIANRLVVINNHNNIFCDRHCHTFDERYALNAIYAGFPTGSL